VVLCDCVPSLNTDNEYPPLICMQSGASLSNIAKGGDDLILFVYWVLVMTVALLCLRIAGLITFFHSDDAEQCFTIDIVVNIVGGMMVGMALILIINWAGRNDQCNLIDVSKHWFSTVPMLVVSMSTCGLVAVIDMVTVFISTDILHYTPVLSMTQDSHVHVDLGVQEQRRGSINADTDAANETSSSKPVIKPVYTIDDEVEIEDNESSNGGVG